MLVILNKINKKRLSLSYCLFMGLLLLSGCGRQEGAGSTVGSVSGALIGASVAGRHDTATGAVLGGLVGHVVGASLGRAADEQEAEELAEIRERAHARHLASISMRAQEIEAENRILKQANTKWCADCRRQSNLIGAKSCSVCGGELITKLVCHECSRTYSPTSGYSCCPYCYGGVRLHAR